ncbi:MAG: FixH family protein [Hyphomicrobiales bacterium]
MSKVLLQAVGWRGKPEHEGRPLTGRKVLAILVAFFGTVGSVNALMVHYALSSFRGEVADHPYEAGLAFNAELAAARAQEARNWKVQVKFAHGIEGRRLEVSARDAQGGPIGGLRFTGIFAAPVDGALDRRVGLEETGAGVYVGEVPVASGHWDLELLATRDGETLFQSKNRILVE